MKSLESSEIPVNLEAEPKPPVALNGLGLVHRSMGEFPEEPVFDFPCKIDMVNRTGSRPWCVVSDTGSQPWAEVLDGISDEYRIHLLSVDVTGSTLDKLAVEAAINLVKQDIAMSESNIGEVSVYKSGDEISLIAHDHLSRMWAKAIMATIEERLGEVGTTS